jgi:hypothetical protein
MASGRKTSGPARYIFILEWRVGGAGLAGRSR